MFNKAIRSTSLALFAPVSHQNWLQSSFPASFHTSSGYAKHRQQHFFIVASNRRIEKHWNSYHSFKHFDAHHFASQWEKIEIEIFHNSINTSPNAHLPTRRYLPPLYRCRRLEEEEDAKLTIKSRNDFFLFCVWFRWCVHKNQNKYENMFEQRAYLPMRIAQFCAVRIFDKSLEIGFISVGITFCASKNWASWCGCFCIFRVICFGIDEIETNFVTAL